MAPRVGLEPTTLRL